MASVNDAGAVLPELDEKDTKADVEVRAVHSDKIDVSSSISDLHDGEVMIEKAEDVAVQVCISSSTPLTRINSVYTGHLHSRRSRCAYCHFPCVILGHWPQCLLSCKVCLTIR